MNKLASARNAILKSPLHIKADKLLTFAEKGKVTTWPEDASSGNSGFTLTYTIHLIVTDYAGALQDLLYVVVRWVHAECPDMDAREAIAFHVDVIDHKSADVSIAVEVSEIVATTLGAGGKVQLKPAPDPDVRVFDMTAFHGGQQQG